jgi:hypothetical protein
VQRACSRSLEASVRAAATLPGHPKVVVTGYYPLVSDKTSSTALLKALGAAFGLQLPSLPPSLLQGAIRRAGEFSSTFDDVGRAAVASTHGAVYVSSGFGRDDALFAPHTKLWSSTDDEVVVQRLGQCATAPGLTDVARGLCAIASVGHPNVDGAAQYAWRIENAVVGSFSAHTNRT